MAALRPRERRLLIAAGIVLLGALGYVYVAEPLAAHRAATRELVVARQTLLARQRRLVAQADRYAQSLDVLRREIERRRARLLPGDTPPVAAAELQKLVKGIAQDTGIEVRSERILSPVERGGYTEVPVEVTLSGPIRALTSFLYRLERTPVLLTVTDLRVRVVSVTAPRELSATVALAGYFPTPAASTVPSAGPGRTPPVPAGRPGA
jgi:type II secretory pathway component PulM